MDEQETTKNTEEEDTTQDSDDGKETEKTE